MGRLAHRGGETGGEDESARRRETARGPLTPPIPPALEIVPAISSPLTVNSPSRSPLVLLKRNTSPATVPPIGPVRFAAVVAVPDWINSVTVDPCCFRSNVVIVENPSTSCQLPVTSTVTNVRSIQSVLAQPAPIASAVAMRIPMRAFIAVRERGRTGRAAIGSGPWEPSFQAGRSVAERRYQPVAQSSLAFT